MSKKNIWVLYYISALFIFLILSMHYLSPFIEKKNYYNYHNIIKYLNDQVYNLSYGQDEYTLEKYADLKKTINTTIDTIKLNVSDLENDYKKNEYSFEEYYTRKNEYENYLNRLDQTLLLLEDKVK